MEKLPEVSASILSNETDIFILTETWIPTVKQKIILDEFESLISGYDFISEPRKKRQGGGIGAIVRDNIKVHPNKGGSSYVSFEHLYLNLSVKSDVIHLIIVYRPPPSAKNGYTVKQFMSEFSSLLATSITSPGRLLISIFTWMMRHQRRCGSFRKSWTQIAQRIFGPTHAKGHTLDLVITRCDDDQFAEFQVSNELPSDHSAVHFRCHLTRLPPQKITCSNRNLRVTREELASSVLTHRPALDQDDVTVHELMADYNTKLAQVLDEVAPVKEKKLAVRPRAPWFDSEILEAKTDLRCAERRMKTTRLEIHRQMFLAKRAAYNNLIRDTKDRYY